MDWRYPYILIFLIAFILIWIIWRFRTRSTTKNNILSDRLKENIDPKKQLWKRRFRVYSLIFLIIAAAGPLIGTRVKPVERKGVDLIFAVDVSVSMNAEDVKPTRLEKAKYEISQVIQKLKGDRVGIIVFAGSAHYFLPLTGDYEAARLFLDAIFLDAIETKMIKTQGTALSAALKTSIAAFPDESKKYKVLVLVTDGEDHEGEAIAIAEKASKTGIVINTVGVGSATGSLIPIGKDGQIDEYKRDKKGQLITTVLNETILRDIAKAGNGIFIRIDNQTNSSEKLNNELNAMDKKTFSMHEYSEYEDRYQIFAIFSLIFAIIAFIIPTNRRKK
ncbi:MAG: VWA domain-containing protein [Planctomycetia bacterium]|nr:VWA domain-containing protein [Planctomycetia bacterium]